MFAAPGPRGWPSAGGGLSLTSSPLRATHLLFCTLPIGSQPVRSLPLNNSIGALHDFGIGFFNAGARIPEIDEPAASPRFSTPAILSPATVKSHVTSGPRPAGDTVAIRCALS